MPIVLQGRRTSQAPGGVDVNWKNSITSGLVALSNISGAPPLNQVTKTTTSPQASPTFGGLGVSLNGSTQYLTESFGTKAAGYSDFLTVLGLFTATAAPAATSGASGLIILAGNRGTLSVGVDSSGFGCASLGTSGDVYTQAGASVSLLNKESLVIATKDNTTGTPQVQIYQGGMGKTFSGTVGSGDPTYSGSGTLEFIQGRNFYGFFTGFVRLSAVWTRILTPAELSSLTENPWQILTIAPRKMWVATPGSGSTGTVAKTNNNDTSAASGTTTVTGTVAKTNNNDTSAASGTTTVTGTIAKTNANDTCVASGSVGTVTVTISTPTAYQVFQRTRGSTTGTMTITGTYTGSPDNIQAQIVKHGTSTVVVSWTTIVASPSAGSYSGNLTSVPQTTDGSWYDVQVRLRDSGGTAIATTNGTNKTGIGINIALAGQSNALGEANDTPTTANDLVAFYSGSAWSHLVDPIGAAGNSVGPDLGNALVTAYNIPIAIRLTAQGGTNLYSNWARNSGNPSDPTTLYGQLLTSATTLSGVEAIVWMQGETDAGDHRSEAQYSTDLTNFITNLRSDMTYTVPFIFNQLGNALGGSSATDAEWHGIQNAQITRDNGSNILNITAHDATLITNDVHFQTSGGFTKLGPRFSQALQFYLGTQTYYRGPSIASAIYTDGTKAAVDVTITHRAGTTFTPTSAITGFVVLDSGTPATISTAVRQSSTVVRLTLSGAVSGTGTLRYLYGKTPTVTSLVLDNTAMTLPLEGTGSDLTITVPTISGTVAKTNNNDTSAASGTTTVTGTIAKTNANDTCVASGTQAISGTLATTNANDTCYATGWVNMPPASRVGINMGIGMWV